MTAAPANTNRTASASDRIGRRILDRTLRCAQGRVMRENCGSECGLFAELCKGLRAARSALTLRLRFPDPSAAGEATNPPRYRSPPGRLPSAHCSARGERPTWVVMHCRKAGRLQVPAAAGSRQKRAGVGGPPDPGFAARFDVTPVHDRERPCRLGTELKPCEDVGTIDPAVEHLDVLSHGGTCGRAPRSSRRHPASIPGHLRKRHRHGATDLPARSRCSSKRQSRRPRHWPRRRLIQAYRDPCSHTAESRPDRPQHAAMTRPGTSGHATIRACCSFGCAQPSRRLSATPYWAEYKSGEG
jgi:hypothetical protein